MTALEHHHLLGKGEFGEVWLVDNNNNNNNNNQKCKGMALKVQKNDSMGLDNLMEIREEIRIMSMFCHPFVVELIASCKDGKKCIYILIPLFLGGALFDGIYQQDQEGNIISGLREEQNQFYAAVISD
jgi:serine/threonine protein kinase